MRTLKIFMGILMLSPLYAQSPWDVIWSRIIDNGGDDIIMDLETDWDGNFVGVGYTDSYDLYSDLLLVKLDSSGNALWQKVVGPGNNSTDYGMSVAIDSSGYYLVAGHTDVNGYLDTWFLKVDSGTGDTIWTRTFDLGSIDRVMDVAVDGGGNYVATGFVYYSTRDFFVMRLDSSDGDTLMLRIFVSSGYNESIRSVALYPDGDIVVGGTRQSDSDYSTDGMVVRLDSMGNIIWSVYIDGGGNDYIRDIIVDSDGHIAFAGYSDSYSDSFDVWVGRIAPDGSILWTANAGTVRNDYSFSLFQDAQGRYVVSGFTTEASSGTDALFHVINPYDGGVVDSHFLDLAYEDIIRVGLPVGDCGYAFAGYITSTDDDALFLRMRGCPSTDTAEGFESVFTNVYGGVRLNVDGVIEVFSSAGKRLMQRRAGAGEIIHLPSGIYIMTVKTHNRLIHSRVFVR